MKTQMRFQKIFMLVSLILAALGIVFALIFCSGTFFQIHQNNYIFNALRNTENVAGAGDLFYATQDVSDIVLIMGIVAVLVICLNYITGTNSRRNYYITNYVSIGIAIVYEIVFAVVIIALVANCQSLLAYVDWEAAESRFERFQPGTWNYSTWTLGVGYALAVVYIINAAVFVLNLVWKIKLMKGEKALLSEGLVKEVA